jgi:hypothetical protein
LIGEASKKMAERIQEEYDDFRAYEVEKDIVKSSMRQATAFFVNNEDSRMIKV